MVRGVCDRARNELILGGARRFAGAARERRRSQRNRAASNGSPLPSFPAINFWRLKPQDGMTFVRTGESYDELVARLLRGQIHTELERGLKDRLQSLQAEAERNMTR